MKMIEWRDPIFPTSDRLRPGSVRSHMCGGYMFSGHQSPWLTGGALHDCQTAGVPTNGFGWLTLLIGDHWMSQQVVKAIPQSCHNELQEGTITRPYAQASLVCSHLQTPDPTLDPTLKGYTSLSSLELPLTPNKIKIKNVCHEKSMPQRKKMDANLFKSGLTHQIRSVCNALQTSAHNKAIQGGILFNLDPSSMFDGTTLLAIQGGIFIIGNHRPCEFT